MSGYFAQTPRLNGGSTSVPSFFGMHSLTSASRPPPRPPMRAVLHGGEDPQPQAQQPQEPLTPPTQFVIPAGQRLFRTSPTACDYTDARLVSQRRYSDEIDKTGIYFATWPFLSMAMSLEYANDVQLAVFRTSAPIVATIGKYDAPNASHFDHRVGPIAYSKKPEDGHPPDDPDTIDFMTLQQNDLWNKTLWAGELFIVEEAQIRNIHFTEAFTLSYDKLVAYLLNITLETPDAFDMFTLAPYIASGVLTSMTCPDAAQAVALNEADFQPEAVTKAYAAANPELYKFVEQREADRARWKQARDKHCRLVAETAFIVAKDAKRFLESNPEFAKSLFEATQETALFLRDDPRSRDTVVINRNVSTQADNSCMLDATNTNYPLSWSGRSDKEFPENAEAAHTHVRICTQQFASDLTSYALKRPLTDAEREALPFHIPSFFDMEAVLVASFNSQMNANRYDPVAEHVVSERAIVTVVPSPDIMDYIDQRARAGPTLLSPGDVIGDIGSRIMSFWFDGVAEAVSKGQLESGFFNSMFRDLVSTNKHAIASRAVVKEDEPLFYVQILPIQYSRP